jgi:hypothetical protein
LITLIPSVSVVPAIRRPVALACAPSTRVVFAIIIPWKSTPAPNAIDVPATKNTLPEYALLTSSILVAAAIANVVPYIIGVKN